MQLIELIVWLAAAAATPPAPAADAAAGHWQGVIRIPERETEVAVDLARDDHGVWAGSIVAPGFALAGTPLSSVSVQAGAVAFALKGALGDPRFEGRLAAGGTLEGRFQLGGRTAPFLLKRTGPPEVEQRPRNTPVGKPFEGVWSGRTELMGNPLLVRLTLANDAAGAPAVKFFVQGHNPHDLAVDVVTQEAAFVVVHSPDLGGFRFEGELKTVGPEIAGILQQGSVEAPLVLRPEAAGDKR